VKLIEVVPAISEDAGGPSYSVVRLTESLAERGCDVTLAALEWGPLSRRPIFVKTFPVAAGPRRLGRSPAMARWLTLQARTGEMVLFHNHSLWMMPNVYPGLIARRHAVSYVVSPRGTLSNWAINSGSVVKRLFWPLVQRPSLAALSCWHATSDAEYSDIRACGFRQPVAVIPNGVDLPDLPAKERSDVRTLLFLGRIHPIKGLDVLLRAWRATQQRFGEWRLIIAGPDNDGHLARVQTLASDLKLERVYFVGPLYGRDKWLAYGNSDLFVLPTHSENFGLAVAEALAAGTPVIVTRGAPWQALRKYQAGWWIDIGLEPLIAAFEEAFDLPEERLCWMGNNGRAWMQREFSWNAIGLEMANFYRWLCGRGDRPASVRVD
jgi:glycosyltransferase involved in cell wall biosynthesis